MTNVRKTALKSLLFLLVVPGMVLFYIPYRIANSGPTTIRRLVPLQALAVVPWISGSAFVLWSIWDFTIRGQGTPAPVDPPKELVVHGMYRYVRNPMYLGAVLVLVGHFLWYQSIRLLFYTGAVFSAFHLFTVLYEEPNLQRRFGAVYTRYRQSVPRWIPRLPG